MSRIKLSLQEKRYLGNLEAKRDWGYAKEYVEEIWMMLQCDEPDDFVLANGETYSIRDLLGFFCDFLGFCGEHLELDWHSHVEIDPMNFWPTEVNLLLGDASKAKEKLGWQPKINCRKLAGIMIEHDIALFRTEGHGVRSC